VKKLLSQFNLGDAYEIQARVLPAMLVVLPVAVLVAQIAISNKDWLALVGWGAGLEVILAVLVSKVGHASGARLQGRLEMTWGGLPTHAWLRPTDQTHSEQQRKAWWKALSKVSGLNIEEAAAEGDAAEMDRIISDAVMAARHKIKGHKKARLVQTHNITFGFARNLAGMRWLTLVICMVCSAVSGYGSFRWSFETAGTVLQLLFLVIAAVYFWLADGYVRHCAVRYAEFFFSAVVDIAGQPHKGTR
jgi:hypothetical protein